VIGQFICPLLTNIVYIIEDSQQEQVPLYKMNLSLKRKGNEKNKGTTALKKRSRTLNTKQNKGL
jgi:hypothetical protein